LWEILHGIRGKFIGAVNSIRRREFEVEKINWAMSLQRKYDFFCAKFSETNRIFGFLVKKYPNSKTILVESEFG